MTNRGCSLEQMLQRFQGQPVEILTSDGVRYCGIELGSCEDGVEIIDRCGRIIFILFRHIDAVVEPMMKLTTFCGERDCDCRREEECCGEGHGGRDRD